MKFLRKKNIYYFVLIGYTVIAYRTTEGIGWRRTSAFMNYNVLTFYRICKWRSCLQRAIEDNGRSGQNVFRNLHDSVAVLRVSSRHESRDAAIRFPRMSNWTLTRWENRPRNTRRRKTTNANRRRSKVSLSVKHGRYEKKKKKKFLIWASSMPISLIVLHSFILYTAIVINI